MFTWMRDASRYLRVSRDREDGESESNWEQVRELGFERHMQNMRTWTWKLRQKIRKVDPAGEALDMRKSEEYIFNSSSLLFYDYGY